MSDVLSNRNPYKGYNYLRTAFPNHILLFEFEGSYTTFLEDAEYLSKLLEIPLTTSYPDKIITVQFPIDLEGVNLKKIINDGRKITTIKYV